MAYEIYEQVLSKYGQTTKDQHPWHRYMVKAEGQVKSPTKTRTYYLAYNVDERRFAQGDCLTLLPKNPHIDADEILNHIRALHGHQTQPENTHAE